MKTIELAPNKESAELLLMQAATSLLQENMGSVLSSLMPNEVSRLAILCGQATRYFVDAEGCGHPLGPPALR
jgi:hypothetical protein